MHKVLGLGIDRTFQNAFETDAISQTRKSVAAPRTSDTGGESDVIGQKADIDVGDGSFGNLIAIS